MDVPSPYELVLLTLGGFRLVRLIGWDSLTEGARIWLTGFTDELRVVAWRKQHPDLGDFIRCPWCMGFWVTLAVWAAWLAFPRAVIVVCVPLALSSLVGLIAKQLDP